ncbi:hypothetical protein F5B19DRAFT_497803 [Rostrohypoxylon terebratum]|nr:hypothetical protein F5B19DRAFT_497803 [Rostrohypoxylon terebratum]
MSIPKDYLPPLSRIWTSYSQSSVTTPIFLISFYLIVIRLLRYRRARSNTKALLNVPQHEDYASSVRRAQIVYRSLINAEFPFLFVKGIELALFRTYAIPTISSLLDKTAYLSSKSSVPRRYSETWALFVEFALADWGSERWIQAMGRTRAIHAAYRKAGKVREDDMLYTLAALATQPVRLINTWEWRSLTDDELSAIGMLYRGLADAFDIDWKREFADMAKKEKTSHAISIFDGVSVDLNDPANASPDSGLSFFHSLSAWQQLYEDHTMRHMPANHLLASTAVDMLLWGVPGHNLKQITTKFLVALMDDPLRIAVGYPAPFAMHRMCVKVILTSRKLALRYLCLPRPSFLTIEPTRVIDPEGPYSQVDSSNNATLQHQSRTLLTSYVAAPYYVKPTIWNRWGPGAWWWWFLGHPLPSQEDQHYIPGGYLIPEIGPRQGKTPTVQAREEEAVRALLRSEKISKI